MSRMPSHGAWAGIVAAAVFGAGCGTLLTKDQTDVLADFAQANAGYAKLPGSVLRAYEDLHFRTRVLGASVAIGDDPGRVGGQVDQAVKTATELDVVAVRFDAALKIFDRYRALLERLSSPDLADLDSAASALGSGFDQSVKAYNALPVKKDRPLPDIGSDIAAGARALGGVWVRNRQLAYLQRFVKQANPVIAQLAAEVGTMIESNVAPSLAADAVNLQNALKDCLANRPVKPGPADLVLFADALRKDREVAALARKLQQASRKLASSHQALQGALGPSPSIHEARAEVDGLITEITAAAKLKSTLDAASASTCPAGG